MRRTRIKKKETQLELLSQCVKIHQKVFLCERSELWFIRIWFWGVKIQIILLGKFKFQIGKSKSEFSCQRLNSLCSKSQKVETFFSFFKHCVLSLFLLLDYHQSSDILCIFSQGDEAFFLQVQCLRRVYFQSCFLHYRLLLQSCFKERGAGEVGVPRDLLAR